MSRSRQSAAAILRHFEAAVRDDEMRGSMHPDDRYDIHERYLIARERLLDHLRGQTDGL